MTEPTAEQVSQERERAIRALGWEGEDCTIAGVRGIVQDIATALARVRIEAHAAGRVEAYAAGKADGAREEREECELTVRDSCICQVAECSCSARLRDIARAIARRGSEGK